MSGRVPLLGAGSGFGKDRKRFIIVSIFDPTICILLWLICTITKGDDWSKIFLDEINFLNPQFIHYSLFDVVVSSVFRMIILLLCYGLLVGKKWYTVAITTAISTVFIICKALFFFSKTNGGLPQYLLVLSFFSIAWFQLWLMPCKVLPNERSYEFFLSSYENSDSIIARVSSRTNAGYESANTRREILSASSNNLRFSTDDEFRSAVDYSSEDETAGTVVNISIPPKLMESYEETLRKTETTVENLLKDALLGGWKKLRADDPTVLQGPDQTYYVRAQFPCNPIVLFTAMWADVLKWNPLVVQGKTILKINASTDLYYSVTAPALKGYISSRDFCDIRRVFLSSEDNTFSGIFVSVESTLCPPNGNRKVVRGTNGPSLIRVTAGDDSNIAMLEWIMKTDLRGGLPKRLVQNSMVNYFAEHILRLRAYIDANKIAS
ncbi:unnamed protein product [Auanema sp. JU1783]|nr:unnamed protein product [Auanema sp. JU1783]